MSLRCLIAWEQNSDSKSTDNWNWSKKCLRSFFFFEGRLIMHQFSGQIFQRTEFLMFLFPSHLFNCDLTTLFSYIFESWGLGIRCDLINNIYASKIGKDNAKRSMQREEVKWKKKKFLTFSLLLCFLQTKENCKLNAERFFNGCEIQYPLSSATII